VFFNTASLPKPIISVNSNTLTSSATSGNQWFLNGQIIVGATNQQHSITSSGLYSVQVTQNGCLSEISEGINLVYTAVFDPVLNSQVLIAPNPVNDVLYIKNKNLRPLEIHVNDLNGKKLKVAKSRQEIIIIQMRDLPPGSYFITIRDSGRNKVIARKILKL